MLKIKDSVDLKLLEDFSFEKQSYPTPVGRLDCYTYMKNKSRLIKINPCTREIIIAQTYSNKAVDVLFDLISKNLVERIS